MIDPDRTHKTPGRVRMALQDMVREMGSINKVVKRTGITHNTIGTWLEGRSEPEQSSLEKLAAAYGKSVAWLRGDVDKDPPFLINGMPLEPCPPPAGLIPVVSMASANGDGPCWEDAYPVGHGMEQIWRPHDVVDPRAFGVKVDGDSMTPVFRPGDTVVVCPQKQVVNGDEVVARLRDGRVVVKVIRYLNGYVLLESYNTAYEPIFSERDQVEFAYKIVWHKRG